MINENKDATDALIPIILTSVDDARCCGEFKKSEGGMERILISVLL